MERQINATLFTATLLAALAAVAAGAWTSSHHDAPAANANATVDALATALQRGLPPQPLLDAFASAGSIRAATLYAAGGGTLATRGTPSPDVEQLFRSLPGGRSLSVEPRGAPTQLAMRNVLTTAAIAALCAATIALLASSLVAGALRRRFDRLRTSVDDAGRDLTYATRIPAEAGALRPLALSLNQFFEQMQHRDVAMRRRTAELETANKDLESFASTVSHDLRAPVGSISGFAQALDEDYGPKLDEVGRECIYWIRHSASQMNKLIEGMLQMAQLTRAEVHRTSVDISSMAREITGGLQRAHPERDVAFVVPEGLIASGDERLLRAVLENLIGNAFKFTGKRSGARIEIGARQDEGAIAFYVRDNGAGFAPEYASKMFRPFQRLHSEKEFSGTGIGLATVHRIVQRHGGRVWAEGEPEKGATVYFTTGSAEEWVA